MSSKRRLRSFISKRLTTSDGQNPDETDHPLMFEGYSLPLDLVMLTGGGPETFGEISATHMQQIDSLAPIAPTDSVLELGCGIGRDAIPLTQVLASEGRYAGIDIIRPSIEWCRVNITKRHPNFSFFHIDVEDELHNPNGSISNLDVSLPASDASVDRIISQSVFTHMFADEVTHYLAEFRRILTPGGSAMTSFFITDEAIANAPTHTAAAIGISSRWGDGCYVHDPARPRAAVAFTRARVEEMAADAGLRLRSVSLGVWSGFRSDFHPLCGQDMVVFERES